MIGAGDRPATGAAASGTIVMHGYALEVDLPCKQSCNHAAGRKDPVGNG
jgi:hypothetical protein